ncbi:MAG: NfeD family protein [Syntrophomonadaceae bacterium]|nr:NfeD family protein [Syntrophomonadaceae bacterium]
MSYMAWLIIGIGCVIIEIATVGFWFLWLSIAALTLSLLTWLQAVTSLPAQIIIFGIITISLIIFTRPLVQKFVKTDEVKSNVEALVGVTGIVTAEIDPPHTGQVNLQGEIWTARANEPLSQNEKVVVKSVEGVTLNVEPFKE